MRIFLFFWITPLAFLGLWYGLSYYDVSFGTVFLSRELHDTVFAIYGELLGMKPETIPPLLLRAIVIDSLVVLAIIAFRRRRQIAAWLERRRAAGDPGSYSRDSDESLSRAP